MTKHLQKPLPKPACVRSTQRRKSLEWSAERRARQAELIRTLEPWEKSTGPRTDAGKIRCTSNALKHGYRSRGYIERKRDERQLLRDSARIVALTKTLLRALSVATGHCRTILRFHLPLVGRSKRRREARRFGWGDCPSRSPTLARSPPRCLEPSHCMRCRHWHRLGSRAILAAKYVKYGGETCAHSKP